jgi:hypothetical protein
MANTSVEITVKLAWWLKPYLYGVVMTAVLMGLEPDWDKVQRTVMRAMRVRIK